MFGSMKALQMLAQQRKAQQTEQLLTELTELARLGKQWLGLQLLQQGAPSSGGGDLLASIGKLFGGGADPGKSLPDESQG